MRASGKPRLTPRQREVLHLLARGASHKLVARNLGIKKHTVDNHMTGIYNRLGFRNRTLAVLWWEREGKHDGDR